MQDACHAASVLAHNLPCMRACPQAQEVAQLAEELQSARTSLAGATARLGAEASRCQLLASQANALRTQLAVALEANTLLSASAAHATAELVSLRRLLEEEGAARASLAAAHSTGVGLLQAQLTLNPAEVSGLSAQLAAANQAHSAARQADGGDAVESKAQQAQRTLELEAELSTLRERCAALEGRAASAERAQQAVSGAAPASLGQHSAEVEALQQQLASATKAHAEDVEGLRAQLAAARNVAERMREELAEERAKLAGAQGWGERVRKKQGAGRAPCSLCAQVGEMLA